VQLRPSGADAFDQSRLDIHVQVFPRRVPLKFAGRDFRFDLAQAARDDFEFICGNNFGRCQSGGMRKRARDIVPVKPLIKRD